MDDRFRHVVARQRSQLRLVAIPLILLGIGLLVAVSTESFATSGRAALGGLAALGAGISGLWRSWC